MRPRPFLFVIGLVLSSAATGQRTWVVDRSGGAGHDFRDLPAAFLNARDGDTILVRRGTYSSFRAGVAVRLLGEPGAVVTRTTHASEIKAIGTGRTFVAVGVSFTSSSSTANERLLEISDCSGAVVLDRVSLLAGARNATNTEPYALEIQRSPLVGITGCVMRPGIRVTSSEVSLTASQVQGADAARIATGPTSSAPAVRASDSTLIFSQCVVTGGNGQGSGPTRSDPAPALRTVAGGTVLAGDLFSVFSAGRLIGHGSDALVGSGGNLLHDAEVSLVPSGNGRRHSGFAIAHSKPLRTLVATGAAPGQSVTTRVLARAGFVTVLFASPPSRPVLVGDLGQLWLRPGATFAFAAGVQDDRGHWSSQLPIPNASLLRGLPLVLQGLSGFGRDFGLTSAALIALH